MADLERPNLRLIARVAPRGHAKSTCASLALPLWSICEQRRRNIVIVSHEAGLATQFLRDIRTELETNEAIIECYGDLSRADEGRTGSPAEADAGANCLVAQRADRSRTKRPARRKWSETVFIAGNGVSVHAKGAGGAFRGLRVGPNRPDLIICDDVEKDDLVESAENRKKLETWLRRVVMPALAPAGRLVVVGSLLHFDSLLANLRDPRRFPRWDYRVYRALEAEPMNDASAAAERGGGPPAVQLFRKRALWPARWPVERLEEERARIGTVAFEQEYQANPIDAARRVFPPEWLRRCTRAEIDGLVERRQFVPLIAVDPATGATEGDYFAMWIGGVDALSGRILTRELLLERIGVVEQVRRIVAAFARHRPVKIAIESVAYQAALHQILEEYGRTNGLYLPLVKLTTHANKLARIEGSACFYENGTFLLPEELSAEAEGQFLHFPRARHDDAPDVCVMAIEVARSVRPVSGGESIVSMNGRAGGRREGW